MALIVIGSGCYFFFWREKNIDTEKEVFTIQGTTYYVSPKGNDVHDGLSREMPLRTIQRALDLIQPGDGAILDEGDYFEDIITRRDATKEKPILLLGSKKAVVRGTGKENKIVTVYHDYHVFSGFSVDGLIGDGGKKEHYIDKLLYAQGDKPLDGVTGLRVISMDFRHAGGECIRIKYFSHNNEIARNHIVGCGAYDFLFDEGGKNGEGIYIGTAPEQIARDKNPTRDVDRSNDNFIHDNVIDTQGNECVDIKEGSSGNRVEKNICTGQKDKESAGLDSRGNGNIFQENEVYGCLGAGIRLGGDEDDDGIENIVKNNYLHNNKKGGIKIQRRPQRLICGNIFADNGDDAIVGEYGDEYKNKKKCEE